MKKIEVQRYDVFTKTPGKGNPVGIIFEADQYTEEEMQTIATTVGYNECCFVCQSEKGDYRLRYFTPGHETPLCGHATIGTIYAIVENMKVTSNIELQIETLVGVIRVQYGYKSDEVMMEQANAQFIEFDGDKEALMLSIGLSIDDYDQRYPIVFGSTGSWTTIVPIKHLSSFKNMKPNNVLFPDILKQQSRASIHPMTFEVYDSQNQLHGRHFSSCYSGTVEDSVTGTASGVMAAYYLQYIESKEDIDLFIEQGHEINKEGIVHAFARKDDKDILVSISGRAVKGELFNITI